MSVTFWGWDTSSRESALASIQLTKNAPHRTIRGEGPGGSEVGCVGLIQNTIPPLTNAAGLVA